MLVNPPIGSSRNIEAEYMKALRRAWDERRLVLFLGAGVSVDYGIPQWNSLIHSLLYGTSQLDGYWPHYRMALMSRLATSFDFSPVTLARVVKYTLMERKLGFMSGEQARKNSLIVFKKQVKEQLYGKIKRPQKDTTLKAVADLVELSERDGRRIQAVLTTNFDDLLELEVEKRPNQNGSKGKIRVERVHDERRRKGDGLPVIHVHGMIPRKGNIPDAEIVFTEDDYHRLTYSLFHWAISEITSYLHNYTVLFVGVSMADPNLRRLLDATYMQDSLARRNRGQLYHYLMRKDYTLDDEAKEKTIDAVIEDAQRFGKEMDAQMMKKGRSEVDRAVKDMLRQAHRYDSDLFRDMGVGLIWAEEFADFPQILRAIPTYGRKVKKGR